MIVDERALVAAVRELAAESPEFVYEAPVGEFCKYVHRTDEGHLIGGCIVGQAALKVGVPIEKLQSFDSWDDGSAGNAFSEFSISPEVLNWLQRVQESQDAKSPWGDAVAHADRFGDPLA